ncbi:MULTISPECIES: hypothetical protein [Erwinia]|uniref:hypothetical protein n=1 Tax=Erwinia TaxID=551 RepID=UPI000557D083|nr:MULTISPECIES: hypothetical protein [Erwinia]
MSYKSLSSPGDAQSDYAQQMDNIRLKTQQDMLEKNQTDFENLLTNTVASASSQENTAITQSKLQF